MDLQEMFQTGPLKRPFKFESDFIAIFYCYVHLIINNATKEQISIRVLFYNINSFLLGFTSYNTMVLWRLSSFTGRETPQVAPCIISGTSRYLSRITE